MVPRLSTRTDEKRRGAAPEPHHVTVKGGHETDAVRNPVAVRVDTARHHAGVDNDRTPEFEDAARRLLAKASPAGYVPETMRINARRGVAWYMAGRAAVGLDPETVRIAREIAAGRITGGMAANLASWFPSHMSDLDQPTAQPGHPRYPSTGVVAHALHGGGTRAQSRETLQWARNHQPQVSKAAPGLVAIRNLTGETATRLATLLLLHKADVSREARDPSGRWSAGSSAGGSSDGGTSGLGANRGDLERRRATVQAEHDRLLEERDLLHGHLRSLDIEHQRAMGRGLPAMGSEYADMGDQEAARAIRQDRDRYLDVLREHDAGIADSHAELGRLNAVLSPPEPPEPDFLPGGRFASGNAVQGPRRVPRPGDPGTPGGPPRRDVARQLRNFDTTGRA